VYDGSEVPPALLEALDDHTDWSAVKPRTRRELRRAAVLWDDFGRSKTSITYTGFGAITNELFAEFRDFLLANGQSATTCVKTLDYVKAVLGRLTEKGLIERVPTAKKPRRKRASKRVLSEEHLTALYQAAGHATWPADGWCSPADCWRVFVALMASVGPRPWDAVLMPTAAFILDPTCPDPDVSVKHRCGWLSYTPTKTEGWDRELILPLNSVLLRHVEPLLYDRPRPELLPFGRRRKGFYDGWAALIAAAGLERHGYTPKDLRKSCETAYNRLPGRYGKWITGHAPTGVSEIYYEQVIPGLCDVIERSHLLGCLHGVDRQLRLFA